jgi:hypothetical protein
VTIRYDSFLLRIWRRGPVGREHWICRLEHLQSQGSADGVEADDFADPSAAPPSAQPQDSRVADVGQVQRFHDVESLLSYLAEVFTSTNNQVFMVEQRTLNTGAGELDGTQGIAE